MSTPIFSGKARVQATGVNLYIQEFNVEAASEFADITTFEDYDATRNNDTFTKRMAGRRTLKFSMSGFLDADLLPDQSGLVDGATVMALKFYVDKHAGFHWNVPSSTINKVQTGARITGTNFVTFTCDGESQGGFDYPES